MSMPKPPSGVSSPLRLAANCRVIKGGDDWLHSPFGGRTLIACRQERTQTNPLRLSAFYSLT